MNVNQRIPIVLLAAGLVASGAIADNEHYQRYVVGERSGGMGGAAVAGGIGLDAAYYNPAGLAWATHDSLSMTANLYGFQHYHLDDVLVNGQDLSSDSFVTIPASAGGIWRLADDYTFAFGVFQPVNDSIDEFTGNKTGSSIFSFSSKNQSIWFGPSVGFRAQTNLSFGAAVYGVYDTSKTSYTRHSGSGLFGGHGEVDTQKQDLDCTSVLGLFGAQWLLPDDWRLGLALQTPSLRVMGHGKLGVSSNEGGDSFSIYDGDLDGRRDRPMKLALGIARQKERQYGYGVDVTWHAKDSYKEFDVDFTEDFSYDFKVHRDSVVDVNLGGEYYIAEKFPVRGGFYTSFSSASGSHLLDDDNLSNDDIDLYGVTFSVGYETENTAINLGVNFAYGKGDAAGYSTETDENGMPVSRKTDAEINQLLFTLSTSYYF